MPKYHWKGSIAFGLVSIPIFLVPTEKKSANISFHQIDKRDNARIKYKRINVNTGKEVPWEEITRGYEYDEDTNIPVPDEVLKKVGGDHSHIIEIDNFIDKKYLNPLMIDKSYYVLPDKKAEKGYVILREALKDSGKVGIAKVIISTREYLCAVMGHDDALLLFILKWDAELKPLDEVELPTKDLKAYKVNKSEIEIAKKLISSMSKKWNPEKYVDEYQDAVHQWVEETVKNIPHKKVANKRGKEARGSVDFVALLRKSLKDTNKKTKKTKLPVKALTKQIQKQARHATKH